MGRILFLLWILKFLGCRLGVVETAQLALTFTALFFLGNYSYQVSFFTHTHTHTHIHTYTQVEAHTNDDITDKMGKIASN